MKSLLPKVIADDLIFENKGKKIRGGICVCNFSSWNIVQNLENYLHPKEKEYYDTLTVENRMKSYLMGRYAAKKAVLFCTRNNNLESIFIQWGIFNQPIVTGDHCNNIQVSITHSGDYGAAIAFPENLPVGIDIEQVDPRRIDVLENQISLQEKELLKSGLHSYNKKLTMLWTVKEALSKILRTGLTATYDIFEVDKIKYKEDRVVNYFKNFPQYCAISFELEDTYICSIVYPKTVELSLDTVNFKRIDLYTKLQDAKQSLTS